MNNHYLDHYDNDWITDEGSKVSRGLNGLIAAAKTQYLVVTQELVSLSLRKSYAAIADDIHCGNVSTVNKICALADMDGRDGLFMKYIELMLPVHYCVKKRNLSPIINGHPWESRFFIFSEEKMINCLSWYSADNYIDYDTFRKVYYLSAGNTLFPLMFLSYHYKTVDWRTKITCLNRLPRKEVRQIKTVLSYAALDEPLLSYYGYFVNGRLASLVERRSALNELISADLLADRDIMVSDSMLKRLGPGDTLKRYSCVINFMQKHLGKHCSGARRYIPRAHIQAWRDDIQYLEMRKSTMAEEYSHCV